MSRLSPPSALSSRTCTMRSRKPGIMLCMLSCQSCMVSRIAHKNPGQRLDVAEVSQDALPRCDRQKHAIQVAIGLVALERDAERRPPGPDAVEEVNRKVRTNAPIREPAAARRGTRFGIEQRVVARIERDGGEKDRKAQAHADGDHDGQLRCAREPAVAGIIFDLFGVLDDVVENARRKELFSIRSL